MTFIANRRVKRYCVQNIHVYTQKKHHVIMSVRRSFGPSILEEEHFWHHKIILAMF